MASKDARKRKSAAKLKKSLSNLDRISKERARLKSEKSNAGNTIKKVLKQKGGR